MSPQATSGCEWRRVCSKIKFSAGEMFTFICVWHITLSLLYSGWLYGLHIAYKAWQNNVLFIYPASSPLPKWNSSLSPFFFHTSALILISWLSDRSFFPSSLSLIILPVSFPFLCLSRSFSLQSFLRVINEVISAFVSEGSRAVSRSLSCSLCSTGAYESSGDLFSCCSIFLLFFLCTQTERKRKTGIVRPLTS